MRVSVTRVLRAGVYVFVFVCLCFCVSLSQCVCLCVRVSVCGCVYVMSVCALCKYAVVLFPVGSVCVPYCRFKGHGAPQAARGENRERGRFLYTTTTQVACNEQRRE